MEEKNSVNDLIDDLIKEYKQNKIEQCDYFVSTGSTLLDYAISNGRPGGIPAGKLTEITGEEATGKTAIASHIAANTQKMGGVAIYIDTEHALRKNFVQRLGVDWDKLIRPTVQTIEQGFDTIEKIMIKTRDKMPEKNKPIVIIWDSIASVPCAVEIEGSFDPTEFMAVKARTISLAMRKITEGVDINYVTLIFINQLRENLKVKNPYVDPFISPGGKSIPFHASVRIRLHTKEKIKNEFSKEILGHHIVAKVVKNRLGPPFREAIFPFMFENGIDNEQSIYNYLHDIGKIEKSRGNSKIVLDGKEIIFPHNDWKQFFNEQNNNKAIIKLLDEMLIKNY